MKRILSLCLGLVAFVAVPVMAQAPAAAPTGKIHGHVINPTGAPQGAGNVTALPSGKDKGDVFQVNAQGEFTGEVPAGTYTLVFRMPDTPQDKQVDKIENVKVTAGQTTEQDIDMSREAYVKTLPADQQKQLEDMKKHNSEALKANEVIKHLNADLKTVADDIHEADATKDPAAKTAKFTEAEQLMLKDTAAKTDASILWARLCQAEVGLKKFDDAITSCKKAVDLETTSKKPNPEVQGLAQSILGEAYARTGKVEDANAAYDAAAKANPPQASFYLKNQAVIFFQQNNAQAQIAAADKAIAANPNPNDPNLAILYYLKGQGLVGSATMGPDPKNPKQQIIILPPGCAEAYQKYLELAPNGPYAADAQGILQQAGQKVSSSYKAGKKS
ncbi:carboxypeptidase-like regulatory domain-containing protein [Occallatibacter riparius]|uniref:Carboxypeptidase-like regulatory domain-containing protein n=1 Tax=Occallatibacter riparius TaxID=1002689 RepID=A0A9J7BNZ3_9BACT|nr:carboxypeptidase-like regulatory domain-containing protein [Occallatibacter riparius]UWZ84604.1 carboxypeptidase-like regulatory domain-containing protein [Occallatibacter riparius]